MHRLLTKEVFSTVTVKCSIILFLPALDLRTKNKKNSNIVASANDVDTSVVNKRSALFQNYSAHF